jgi:predicted nucleotidyltransferase
MTSQSLTKISKRIHEALSGVEDIIVAYVFGSTAKGKEHAFSDIDIAILLKEPSIDKTMRIHSFLTEVFGDRVDTLLLNFAPPILRYQVVKNGLRVLSNDENARISFEARALSEGLDEDFLIAKVRKTIARRLLS